MSELRTRIYFGLLFGIVLLSGILIHSYSYFAVFLALGWIGIKELVVLLNKAQKKSLNPILFQLLFLGLYSLSFIVSYTGIIHQELFANALLLIGLASTTSLLFILLKDIHSSSSLWQLTLVFFYLILPFCLLHMVALDKDIYRRWIPILLFALTWINDSAAYFVGKSMGKKKLSPIWSPNKTIEGFLGGLICTVCISILLYFCFEQFRNLGLVSLIFIALVVSIIGTLGDLFESRFKRIAQIKDSGKLLPGHGGILDRIDGFIFHLPLNCMILYFSLY